MELVNNQISGLDPAAESAMRRLIRQQGATLLMSWPDKPLRVTQLCAIGGPTTKCTDYLTEDGALRVPNAGEWTETVSAEYGDHRFFFLLYPDFVHVLVIRTDELLLFMMKPTSCAAIRTAEAVAPGKGGDKDRG